MIAIEQLPASADTDDTLMREVAHLVNRVYEVAEDGFWRDGATRTDAKGVAERRGSIDDAYPQLATPCDFMIYRKPLPPA